MLELENKEIKSKIILQLLEKMLDRTDLDTNDKVLLMRAIGRYADQNYEIPTEIKDRMASFIKANHSELKDIFTTDLNDLMGFFHEDYINWDNPDTFENLATINEFYTALLGLWMVDEYDPTNGKAWSLLTETTTFVTNNGNRFARSKKMVNHFRNPTSMNPIQDLWLAMAGQNPREFV